MRNDRITNLNAVDVTLTPTGKAIDASGLYAASVQGIATGAPVGTLKLQFSNDDPSNPSNPTNWSDITGASVAVSAAGVVAIPKTDLAYQYIRAVYVATSGTGTITANVVVKGF